MMKRLNICGVAFLFVLSAFAQPSLNDLFIHVLLQPNGDARITETRKMTITSEGTECYIVIGNLNGSTVSDLEVKDETGMKDENIGRWDVDRSRAGRQADAVL